MKLPLLARGRYYDPTAVVLQVVALLAILLILSISIDGLVAKAYAHSDHRAHYNGREDRVGPYAIFQSLEPEYASEGEPVAIELSIQDRNGRHVINVATMIEIYSAVTGERLYATPWTMREISDFEIFYTFPENGNYQIVVSVSNNPNNSLNLVDPPRSFLMSTTDCDCVRSVFNVNISGGFGIVWNSVTSVIMIFPVIVLGATLGLSYMKRKKTGAISKRELIRYIVMLSAIAGGVVHLAVYSEHAWLRIEYTIFLLSAAGAQVLYGLLFTVTTLLDNSTMPLSSSAVRHHYKRKLAINLIGLVGTAVLVGLYAYSVIFPPPLSPDDVPEELEFSGILAKSLEVFLVIAIVYIMIQDKKDFTRLIRRSGDLDRSDVHRI
jgi:hypothetical protein